MVDKTYRRLPEPLKWTRPLSMVRINGSSNRGYNRNNKLGYNKTIVKNEPYITSSIRS